VARFRVFKTFNQPGSGFAGGNRRLEPHTVSGLGQRGRILKVLQALAKDRSIKLKEVLESFEVYACVYRRLKHPKIVDLCCGHGLTGLLFAIFHRHVRQVTLLDLEESPASRTVHEALHLAFPELRGKVRRVQASLQDFREPLSSDTGLIAVHACGARTDHCLDLAITNRCPIVVVPCCYTGTGQAEPAAIRESLGVAMATDIGRTYRLQNEGYTVTWDSIPPSVTSMNRVIIAHPRSG
jgi:hypothetical protein